MSEYACPFTGQPCEMAQWTADHIQNQFVIPSAVRGQAIKAVLSTVMRCEGSPSGCEPPSPDVLETMVLSFKGAVEGREEQKPTFDFRSEELRRKMSNPVDRALMWLLLLPQAIKEINNTDEEQQMTGLYEWARLYEVLGEHHGGYLHAPTEPEGREIYDALATVSLNFLNESMYRGAEIDVANDISARFATRYVKPEADPSSEELLDYLWIMRREELGLPSNTKEEE